MKRQSHTRSVRGVTNLELLFILLMVVCMLAGVLHGIRFGSSYGPLGKWIGGIGGLIVGVAVAVMAMFMAALIDLPFDRFWRWWRPYPPVCENGTCKGYRGYDVIRIPEEVLQRVKGLSWVGWRCKCGNIYAGGIGYGMQNRYVRV